MKAGNRQFSHSLSELWTPCRLYKDPYVLVRDRRRCYWLRSVRRTNGKLVEGRSMRPTVAQESSPRGFLTSRSCWVLAPWSVERGTLGVMECITLRACVATTPPSPCLAKLLLQPMNCTSRHLISFMLICDYSEDETQTTSIFICDYWTMKVIKAGQCQYVFNNDSVKVTTK